ncbi:WhiB family transcription factor [Microbacterium phage YellowPanda]|uniref:WhiB family transcription factor n=2 Tax=Tinytimothyvirus tinytimothy TaxID=2845596 RepID=A0A5Q2WL87_9CAUD|nr:transcriptional regulator WhiB-like [Microbacterium phage TinyTimothy]QDF16960.1 WhiB family transcription factor [Microbacterium phage TinyTimothy]QGH78648.1 WhiB family transcription factor [Microbacterium phage Wesak]
MVARIYSDGVAFESPLREEWMDTAACAYSDPEIFFPTTKDMVSTQKAKKICADCPVRLKCLAKALVDEKETSRRSGIFGGMTATERRELQQKLNDMQKAQASANSEQEEETNEHSN